MVEAEINGRKMIVLQWDGRSLRDIRQVAGQYFCRVRTLDLVAELTRIPGSILICDYVRPGDLVVRPEDEPGSRPVVIAGDVAWAAELLGCTAVHSLQRWQSGR